MRRRTALLAGMASLVPVISVASAPSAAAFDEVTVRREFRFPHHGQQLSCTVEGRTGIDADEGSIRFTISTEMIDEDPRCQNAISDVAAGLGWWHPGEELGESAFSGASGPLFILVTQLTNVDRAESYHEWNFDCDGANPCTFRFGVPVYPK